MLVSGSQGPKPASRAYTGHPQAYSPKVLFSYIALGAEVGKGARKGVGVWKGLGYAAWGECLCM